MYGFVLFCLLVAFVIVWARFRNRVQELEARIAALSAQLAGHDRALTRLMAASTTVQAPPKQAEPPGAEELVQAGPPMELPNVAYGPPIAVEPVPMRIPTEPMPAPVAPHSAQDWEAVLGGNWLNKVGVFVLVVGIALALGYSFTHIGPLGRVLTSLAVSLAMLGGGAALERRETYRVFGRGLLGGGWAALYTTVYAMHAVEAARVVPDPVIGFILLIGVAAGMIIHSLRYDSETVTGLAYFVAFGTLAITDASQLPLLTLIPLAASLLYVAHRLAWQRMVFLGLIATYAVLILHGDTGAPLWEAQGIFAVYWVLFEVFDVVHPGSWLLPLNAAGFLGLSLMKWNASAHDTMWIFLACAAVAYAVNGVARIRSGEWHGAATLTAALAAAAVFQKLDHQWVASALVVEAELFYLAGIRLRSPFLRWLGTGLFGVEVGRLLLLDIFELPAAAWVPVASVDALVFYANRAIYAADAFYGFAGAAMLAIVTGKEVPEPYRGAAWMLEGAGAVVIGWARRLIDFRAQGYLLGALGLGVAITQTYEAPLGLAAVLSFAVVLIALRSAPERFFQNERVLVALSGSVGTTVAASILIWRVTDGQYLGLAWMALAAVLLEFGLRRVPEYFRLHAHAIAMLAAGRLWSFNLVQLNTAGDWSLLLAPVVGVLLAYAMAARIRQVRAPDGDTAREQSYYALMGTILTTLLLYYQISGSMLTVAWGIEGAALLGSGFPLRERLLRVSGLTLLLFCILKLFVWDLRHLETLARIFSFIILGLILVGVSWVYTRFRERVAKYL